MSTKVTLPTEASSTPEMTGLDRRKFIAAGSSALMMSALALSRARGQDIEKVTTAQHDKSMTDPGPENGGLKDLSQNGFLPPPTDHGEAPEFWNSFSIAHRRGATGWLDTAGHGRGLPDLEGHRGREHAAHRRRHSRTALA